MKVTVCEMPDDPSQFEEAWGRLSRHVKRESSDLVLLPEVPFFYWFPASAKPERRVWKEAVKAHQKWTRRQGELGAPTVLGTRTVEKAGRRLNEGFVWTRGGRLRGVHYKHYLPDEPGYNEATWYEPGSGPFTPFQAGGWKAGFMICSDLWSMADAASYGRKGVGLIAVPRCTPISSVRKWVAGGTVAAVISGAYSLSSNRSGSRGGVTFGGAGWVVDPNGNLLGLTSRSKPFITVEVDHARVVKAKKTYPRDALNRR